MTSSRALRSAAAVVAVGLVAAVALLLGRGGARSLPHERDMGGGAASDLAGPLLPGTGRAAAAAPTAPVGAAPHGGSSLPVDLGKLVEQVHFAFREDGGAWRGGHDTYAAARHDDGTLEVTPFHFPGGASSPAPRGSPRAHTGGAGVAPP